MHKNCYKIAGQDSPPIYRVSLKPKQSICGGGNKQDKSRWNIFSKMVNTGGIIQEDNSAGHRFVLRDLGSIDKKNFWVSESVKKGNFMTKIFFQIMLNEVIKRCEK